MSDTLQQLWRSWEGQEPAFYELAYGAWSGWLVLYFGWSLLLRMVAPSLQVSETWRLGLVHLLGASFYVVNHYFAKAPFYRCLLYAYASVFFVLFYVILVLPLSTPRVGTRVEDEEEVEEEGDEEQSSKRSLNLAQQLVVLVVGGGGYTVSFIVCENVARLLGTGAFLGHQITAAPILPEALIQVVSVFMSAIIIVVFNNSNNTPDDIKKKKKKMKKKGFVPLQQV
ncbi:uncharacterized protein ACA1_131470 [Acanthamoeba castellanii str. Neff]|uniref:Uncharacterized protein n=1 Tax=Acanthamoeba castellanii (strain ATCC 30010 / Neff) TaxID=1257118 RepID=L8GMW5_ACACF|nr:uncharacterized protein ACA1_131470 [Acanthamoeba castellanii str. Neff]ELR14154.1 hypothetical protein ACA1_131470 [Acanthamoeba castellanii str. Neff]